MLQNLRPRSRALRWPVGSLPDNPDPAQETGKKLALLVGVDEYSSDSGFSSLPFPTRDIDQLAQFLRDSGYRPEHVRR